MTDSGARGKPLEPQDNNLVEIARVLAGAVNAMDFSDDFSDTEELSIFTDNDGFVGVSLVPGAYISIATFEGGDDARCPAAVVLTGNLAVEKLHAACGRYLSACEDAE